MPLQEPENDVPSWKWYSFFKIAPSFKRPVCFYVTVSENFKRFQYINFNSNFLENENLLQKPGVPFLVETTKIENTSFSFKTALSKANIKTNKVVTTK